MAKKKLSQKEVARRLIRLRNLERLHSLSKQMRNKKDEIITLQKQQIEGLERQCDVADKLIKAQAVRIAELEAMVFGKKKKPPLGGTPASSDEPELKPKQPRDKSSYRRPIPPAHAITNEEPVPLAETCTCGGEFVEITIHDRYVEDIPLADLTEDYQAHLVTKCVVERGVCGSCGKATTNMDLGGQDVSLGPNIRLLICHLVTVVGLSYAQVIQLTQSLYGLKLSDGEIANALAKQHKTWLPAYEQLKADTRASPVKHYDETPWKIRDSDNSGYAWVMSAAGSPNTVFHLASSRGAPHAKKLHSNADGIYITDDYSLYRNLSGQQQLCWAHPFRHIRDLRYNDNLPEEQLPYVKEWYEEFAGIYQTLRSYLDQPYDQATRRTQSEELWQRIQLLAARPVPKSSEPDKLTRLKAQLLRAGKDRWFTCLTSDTPCDNNRAERDLRPLVLKRKRSFGSKTLRGANALSTVLSICTTTWKANPDNYFASLAAI